MARAYNASTVSPQVQQVYGVTERNGPFEGNCMIEWEYMDSPPVKKLANTPLDIGMNKQIIKRLSFH